MNKGKTYKKNGVLIIPLLFLLYPVLALPKILSEVYKGRYYALHYLSLFLSLMSYLFAPTGDLNKYYQKYELYSSLSWHDFLGVVQFDIVHQTLMYLLSSLGVYFGYFRFIICFVCYELFFYVISYVIQNTTLKLNKKNRFLCFLFFFCMLGFATFLRGIRYNLATAFFFYGYCKLFYENKKTVGFIFFLLTVLTHYSLIPIVVVTMLFKFKSFDFNKISVIITFLLLYVLSATLLVTAIHYLKLGMEVQERLDIYTTGYWASEVLDDHSLKFRLAQILSRLTFYPMIVIFFVKIHSYKQYNLFLFLLAFLILVFDMNTVFNRYAFLAMIAFSIPYFLAFDTSFTKQTFNILLFVSIVSYISSIYSFRRELSIGNVEKAFYMPLPLILEVQYDKQWVDSHIYYNGDFNVK